MTNVCETIVWVFLDTVAKALLYVPSQNKFFSSPAVDTDQMKTEMFVLNAPLIDSYQILKEKTKQKQKNKKRIGLFLGALSNVTCTAHTLLQEDNKETVGMCRASWDTLVTWLVLRTLEL